MDVVEESILQCYYDTDDLAFLPSVLRQCGILSCRCRCNRGHARLGWAGLRPLQPAVASCQPGNQTWYELVSQTRGLTSAVPLSRAKATRHSSVSAETDQ